MSKRPAPPSKSDANLLQDAKLVVQLARKNFKALVALDADSKVKAVTKESLAAFEKDIRAFETITRAKSAKTVASARATSNESRLRASVSKLLIDLREKVKRRARGDKALQGAMGVGLRLASRLTKDLLVAADRVAGAMDDNAAELAPLGIGKKQKTELIAARDALSAADVGQGDAIGEKLGASAQKAGLRKRLQEQISIVRNAAKALPHERASHTRIKASAFGSRAAPALKKKKAAKGKAAGSPPAAGSTGTSG